MADPGVEAVAGAQADVAALLPIVDLAPFMRDAAGRAAVVADVAKALEFSGFLYVRGLPVTDAQVADAFATAQRFFAKPADEKRRYGYTDIDANFGYQAVEVESLDPTRPPDLKETFTMRNAAALARDDARWPDPAFRDTALAFWDAVFASAQRMLEILATALDVPPGFFAPLHRGENVSLRFLHYPANLPRRGPEQLGAGAHTDYGSITLLFQDDVGGLEVRDAQGVWIPAPPVPGCTVINTGDLMERWTNGRFRSTLHRVRPIEGARARQSIALFVDPDSAVEVECFPSCTGAGRPPRYPVITAGEHIRQKIAATHEATRK